MKESPRESASDWQKTKYANMVRYGPSGTLFARVRIGGKLIRRSLKTEDLAIAKRRLSALERRERGAVKSRRKGSMTFGEALQIRRESIAARVDLKPRSKAYFEERLVALFKTWTDLEQKDVRTISEKECEAWLSKFAKQYCASATNHTLSILQKVLDVAVREGSIQTNPARSENMRRVSETSKELRLPDTDQFRKFIAEIATSGSGKSKPCAELVQFLAYGGFRIGEARWITWAHCDFQRNTIKVTGDPETGLKRRAVGEFRMVPMIAEMKALLKSMRAHRQDAASSEFVMRVRECQKAMNAAAEKVGMDRITHHDLRHFFATRAIESGVDIPTVAKWLGHKDRGNLAVRIYGHLRDEHSAAMAQKVQFLPPAGENVIPMPQAQ